MNFRWKWMEMDKVDISGFMRLNQVERDKR